MTIMPKIDIAMACLLGGLMSNMMVIVIGPMKAAAMPWITRDRSGDGGGDDETGEHPAHRFLRGPQRLAHVGQRDIGDGGIEELAHRDEHHAKHQQLAMGRLEQRPVFDRSCGGGRNGHAPATCRYRC
jgi:hypothetical protein